MEKGIGEGVEGHGEVGKVSVGVVVGEGAVAGDGFLGGLDGASEVVGVEQPGGEVVEVGVGVVVGECAVVAGGFLGEGDGAFEVFDLGLPGRKLEGAEVRSERVEELVCDLVFAVVG